MRVDEQQTAAENFQVESLSLKALQAKYPLHLNKNCLLLRAVASGGGSGARPPHLKSVSPHFTFGPLAAAYIQYSIFKMWPPF